MMTAVERNCREFGIRFFGLDDDRRGIVHVVGPEQGLTQQRTIIESAHMDHNRRESDEMAKTIAEVLKEEGRREGERKGELSSADALASASPPVRR